MKLKPLIIFALIATALVYWNIREFPDFRVDDRKIKPVDVALKGDVPRIEWNWFDDVIVEVNEGTCRLISLPLQLEELDGREVIVAGPSFACGDELVHRIDGYTIKGFIMVPYFGMIDCCIGNPVPYFQWTVVVERLAEPWEINHRGIINPDVVVQGVLHVERNPSREGIFMLGNARVIHSADAEEYPE